MVLIGYIGAGQIESLSSLLLASTCKHQVSMDPHMYVFSSYLQAGVFGAVKVCLLNRWL
jgi:hypothetical protein